MSAQNNQNEAQVVPEEQDPHIINVEQFVYKTEAKKYHANTCVDTTKPIESVSVVRRCKVEHGTRISSQLKSCRTAIRTDEGDASVTVNENFTLDGNLVTISDEEHQELDRIPGEVENQIDLIEPFNNEDNVINANANEEVNDHEGGQGNELGR